MKKSVTRITIYVIIASLLSVVLLSSCNRYVVDRSAGGACGVWYPKKFCGGKY